MQNSLELYGQSQPEIFYMDNMADKQFLKASFPSLHWGVVPINKYNHLEAFSIPDTIHIFVQHTVTSVNNTMSTILNDLSESDNDHQLVIGFDSEWNIEVSGDGRVIRHGGTTAIIQIAYDDCIYILQVSQYCDSVQTVQHTKAFFKGGRYACRKPTSSSTQSPFVSSSYYQGRSSCQRWSEVSRSCLPILNAFCWQTRSCKVCKRLTSCSQCKMQSYWSLCCSSCTAFEQECTWVT